MDFVKKIITETRLLKRAYRAGYRRYKIRQLV